MTETSTRPVALTIAGSDSSGGAGIQADLKTFTLLGVYGASALTAITAQNTRGVQAATMLEPDIVVQQIESVATDVPPAATKTGMLGTAAMVEAVAGAVERFRLSPLVVDPVMIAKSGDSLIAEDAVEAIIRRLLPLAALATPNRHEAARLAGMPVETVEDAERAAEAIVARTGAAHCVVKAVRQGRDGRAVSVDVLYPGPDGGPLRIEHPWHAEGQPNTHGSGCTFSAAATAWLARGHSVEAAVRAAVDFVDAALASPARVGAGISPLDHFAAA